MANISLRREAETPQSMMPAEPFRAMRDLLGWDPFRELRGFEPLRDLLSLPTSRGLAEFAPAFEVKETKDAFLIKADVAGVKESDLDVSVLGDRITITGKREQEATDKGETWYTYERSYGSFARTFVMPTGIDMNHSHAELKNGVLTVALPKVEQTPVQKIQVKAAEKSKA
jgi:HSP20 family protein